MLDGADDVLMKTLISLFLVGWLVGWLKKKRNKKCFTIDVMTTKSTRRHDANTTTSFAIYLFFFFFFGLLLIFFLVNERFFFFSEVIWCFYSSVMWLEFLLLSLIVYHVISAPFLNNMPVFCNKLK